LLRLLQQVGQLDALLVVALHLDGRREGVADALERAGVVHLLARGARVGAPHDEQDLGAARCLDVVRGVASLVVSRVRHGVELVVRLLSLDGNEELLVVPLLSVVVCLGSRLVRRLVPSRVQVSAQQQTPGADEEMLHTEDTRQDSTARHRAQAHGPLAHNAHDARKHVGRR